MGSANKFFQAIGILLLIYVGITAVALLAQTLSDGLR